VDIVETLARKTMKTILASMVALSLAAGSTGDAYAQTTGGNVAADQKKKELAAAKLQGHRERMSQNSSGRDYRENVLETVPFGSKEWWSIKARQQGGPP
jgi:hypothetical protein